MSKSRDGKTQERARLRRLMTRHRADELVVTPGFQRDEALETVLMMLPTDLSLMGCANVMEHSDCFR
jgi:hypothetical protein